MTRITAVNGSYFALGECLPWKGIFFQVIGLDNETVTLQGVGLTGSEIKRLPKARANA